MRVVTYSAHGRTCVGELDADPYHRFFEVEAGQVFPILERSRVEENGVGGLAIDGAIESSHFEFRQAQIQLNSRQLGIEGKSFLIGGSCLLILLLFGENHTQTPEGGGVLGISLRDGAPCAGGFFQFSLLFEGECVGGTGLLRRRGCW